MKKFLSLFLSVVMLLTLALSVAAAGASNVVSEKIACKPGERFMVDIIIEDNPGFTYLEFTPTVAPELSVVDVTNGSVCDSMTVATQCIWDGDAKKDITTDGILATLTIDVADDAPAGEYDVGFVIRNCSNVAEQKVDMADKIKVVRVATTAIDEFDYKLVGNELVITEYIGDATNVVIGSTYEIGGAEYTVTTIAEEAFIECEITKITLPKTLKTIEKSAFEETLLEKIVIPASVTSIGEDAFYKCESLVEAVVLNKEAEIGEHALGYYGKKYLLVEGFVLKSHPDSTAYAYADDAGITFKNVLAMAGASVTLQHNLALNYKVDKTLVKEYGFSAPYIVAQMNGQTVTLTDYTIDGKYYVFSFRNILPNQMKDTITATLYATFDGTGYSATKDYSVAEYAYSMLAECEESEYAKLRTLLVDMLHYGAATQTYANYKTEALANAELTAEQLAWGTAAEPAMETVLNTAYATVATPAAKWTGAGLNLKDSVALRLQFTAASVEGLSVKVQSGADVWTIPASQFVAGEDDTYTVYFNGLHAGQMRQDIYLTIYNGETAVSNTARYSIGSYAFEMKDSGVAGLAELVKAMMKYGDSANAYAN